MENMTKALEIAASVLIGVLILSLLVFGYNQIREQKNIEQKNEKASQLSKFNINFESYAKDTVYGSEILSLANEVINYNERKAVDGYQEIELEVKISTGVLNGQYLVAGTYSGTSLDQQYKKLVKKIKEADITVFGKSISYWSKLSDKETEKTVKARSDFSESEYTKLKTNRTTYKKYVEEQTDFARKTFKYDDVTEYDSGNGRIIKIMFKDK
ncbi:unknown [Clostridium sp. CAG:780]|nr:unknown [Clostridium sp. CAG:780]